MAKKNSETASNEAAPLAGPLAGHAPENYTPQNIAGKATIVTGGTTGIGLAIARLLLNRGARVLIFGRSKNDLEAALAHLKQTGGEVYGVSADQSKTRDILRVFETADKKLGGVDILINNAADYAASVQEVGHAKTAYVVNANLVGYMSCAHEAIARMKKSKADLKGHIVNIGSLSAEAREEDSDIYVATKAGIQAFSASLRKTINPEGIKVSLIEPGLVESDLTTDSHAEGRRKIAAQKMLEAQDIAEAVHYVLTQPQRCDVIDVQIRPHLQPI